MKKPIPRIIVALVLACSMGLIAGCSSAGDGSGNGQVDETEVQDARPSLENGTYEITAKTDSSMFRIDKCMLHVKDGVMTATLTLPGEGFSRLYFGTSEEAGKAADEDIIEYYLDDAGKYAFDVPVASLEDELTIAAWGQRRDRWYDHTIIFHAPEGGPISDATSSEAPGKASSAPAFADLKEGEQLVKVELIGGTGRADIQSPVTVKTADDGTMTATLVWSSSNFDQMVVDGQQYLPTTTEGGSTFEIPITTVDDDMQVQAETTAMSEPHMIDYTIRFEPEGAK